MSKPKYVKVDNELYEINTDFRVAFDCEEIARDVNISDYERGLAIIYKLFGEKGLSCQNTNKLLESGLKYLKVNNMSDEEKTLTDKPDNKNTLDYKKCEGLIRSSFKFDYNYDPYELEYLHWYDFYNDLENLSTSEFGTCCVLSRIQSILNTDISKIKDTKERTKVGKAIKLIREKYCVNNGLEKRMTKEEEESALAFYKALNVNV